MALASQELAILSSPREKAAAGIDPARYSIQIALLSPSKEHYNTTFPVCANTVEELENILPKDIPVVAEGLVLPLVFSSWISLKGIHSLGIKSCSGKTSAYSGKEAHTDSLDARSIARAGLYFLTAFLPYVLRRREALTSLLRMRREIVKELTADWNRLHALLSESYGYWYDKLKRKSIPKKGELSSKNILLSMLSARTKEERKVFFFLTQEERRVFFPRSPGLPRSIWRVWNGRFAFFWRKLNSWKERNGNWGKRLKSISKKM